MPPVRFTVQLNELLAPTFAGEPAAHDEEGGHSDEEQEALVQEQEEEGWRLPGPRWCHGRYDQGQRSSRPR